MPSPICPDNDPASSSFDSNSRSLQTTIEESAAGPPRKYYRLTEKGNGILTRVNGCWAKMKTGADGLKGEV